MGNPAAAQSGAARGVAATDRIIRLPEVLLRTGLKQSTLYRKIGEGTFPEQIKLSRNCVGWYESQVNEWIAAPR